ncbi:hypothetical protein QR680_016826 [Steinernema hermaphroditum]|uniref:Uncharacterized protein n=1 Tax=Steinernema hermaphroditum TaxID=289476 RepID=A0AA39HDI5_9BILA|nr:hypothetical protein QR680_016826 [Steinernema hermaphroditum]
MRTLFGQRILSPSKMADFHYFSLSRLKKAAKKASKTCRKLSSPDGYERLGACAYQYCGRHSAQATSLQPKYAQSPFYL